MSKAIMEEVAAYLRQHADEELSLIDWLIISIIVLPIYPELSRKRWAFLSSNIWKLLRWKKGFRKLWKDGKM